MIMIMVKANENQQNKLRSKPIKHVKDVKNSKKKIVYILNVKEIHRILYVHCKHDKACVCGLLKVVLMCPVSYIALVNPHHPNNST